MTRFLCVCILFWGMSVFSQEETTLISAKNEALSQIIPSIEKQFKIKFSYIDATIINKPISLQTNVKTTLEE